MTDLSTPERATTAHLGPAHRIGGFAGIAFVVVVIAQNLVRGATFPANDAPTADIIDFYRSHRGIDGLLAILFVVSAIALALYGGALTARLRGAETDAPRLAGLIGVIGIFALFSMVEASDLALSSYVHRGAPAPSSVALLWTLHNAIFAVLLVAIAVALAGLTAASAAAGLIGSRWKEVGAIAAGALAITAAAASSVIDGGPIMALGLLGFLAWLAFVAVSSAAMLRNA